MILVGGASGKTGRAVVRQLVEQGHLVRAWVRRVDQVPQLRAFGAHDVRIGDMRSGSDWTAAVRGASAVYHICPNMVPDELPIGRLAISAAQEAGIERFVFHSVLHAQVESMPHHWNKLRVEEALFESGLQFTILQPTIYMQNVLASWQAITCEGRYRIPYAAATRLSMVDLADVAEVAARVLSGKGHVGATYELVGGEAMSQIDVTTDLSAILGHPVAVEVIPLADWKRQARGSSLNEYQVESLAAMFAYYERYGFCGSTRVLSWLLGRPPTTFAGFVSRHRSIEPMSDSANL